MRNNIDAYGPLEKYIDDATRKSFLEQINETVDWIYKEGENAANEIFKEKLDHFKKIGNPVKERFRFHSEIDVFFTQFANFALEMNEKLNSIPLTIEQRNEILTKYTELEGYFAVIKAEIANKKLFEDIPFSIDEVHEKLDNLKYTVNKIFASPAKPTASPTNLTETTFVDPTNQPDSDMFVEDMSSK